MQPYMKKKKQITLVLHNMENVKMPISHRVFLYLHHLVRCCLSTICCSSCIAIKKFRSKLTAISHIGMTLSYILMLKEQSIF